MNLSTTAGCWSWIWDHILSKPFVTACYYTKKNRCVIAWSTQDTICWGVLWCKSHAKNCNHCLCSGNGRPWVINAIIIIYHHLVMIIWHRYCSVLLLPPGSFPGNEYINYTNLSNKRQPPVNQGSVGYMMLSMLTDFYKHCVMESL